MADIGVVCCPSGFVTHIPKSTLAVGLRRTIYFIRDIRYFF